jgi:hypothetical protein
LPVKMYSSQGFQLTPINHVREDELNLRHDPDWNGIRGLS